MFSGLLLCFRWYQSKADTQLSLTHAQFCQARNILKLSIFACRWLKGNISTEQQEANSQPFKGRVGN